MTREERRKRELSRSSRRNRRILGRRAANLLRNIAINLGYLFLAAVVAWVVLRATLGTE